MCGCILLELLHELDILLTFAVKKSEQGHHDLRVSFLALMSFTIFVKNVINLVQLLQMQNWKNIICSYHWFTMMACTSSLKPFIQHSKMFHTIVLNLLFQKVLLKYKRWSNKLPVSKFYTAIIVYKHFLLSFVSFTYITDYDYTIKILSDENCH